ncbi:putative membrane protein YdfK [compost metagenome]
MIGTIVNTAAIVIGSVAGSVFKKGLKEDYQDILMQAMGLAATALGINAIAQHLPDSEYPVLFIVSLALGGVIGQMLDLEQRFKNVVSRFSAGNLAEGLSTAILLFCVGTMSIIGPIESALNGNNIYLYTNAILDGVTSVVLASTFGIGIIWAAAVLFCWQGSIFLLANVLIDFISPALLTETSIVGGVLILCAGLSILRVRSFKTINLIPALLIPVIFIVVTRGLGL